MYVNELMKVIEYNLKFVYVQVLTSNKLWIIPFVCSLVTNETTYFIRPFFYFEI